MTTSALVLGGGGTVGIAWEIGVLKGLRDAGINLVDANLIVGTSAGSVVGTQLALGMPIETMFADQLAPANVALQQAMSFDPATFMGIAARWQSFPEMNEASRAELGRLALAAKTADEAAWLAIYEARLGGASWPEHLVITGVDAESGAFKAWDRAANVPLVRAVAASCTVPGLFPPVTIDGRRYIDGGVRSGTNADLAQGYDTVLIIAPIGMPMQGTGMLAGKQIEQEVTDLRAGGSYVEVVTPDSEALGAFGPNLMDAARSAIVAQSGVRQGAIEADRLREHWTR